MDGSPPGSSVHGILQARILAWVVASYSRESSWPRDWTQVSCISCTDRQILYHGTTWDTPSNATELPKEAFLLSAAFPNKESDFVSINVNRNTHLVVRPVSDLPRGTLPPQVGSFQCWKQNEMRPWFPLVTAFHWEHNFKDVSLVFNSRVRRCQCKGIFFAFLFGFSDLLPPDDCSMENIRPVQGYPIINARISWSHSVLVLVHMSYVKVI